MKIRMSKDEFQTKFMISTVVSLVLIVVLVVGIFVNPNIFGVLIPFGIIGFMYVMHIIAGKIYVRLRAKEKAKS